MKRYSVRISSKALKDMEDMYDYIVNVLLEPKYAMNQYDRIANSILSLELMPGRINVMGSDFRAKLNGK